MSKMNTLPKLEDIESKHNFSFEIKNIEEKGDIATMEGYGSVTGNIDFGDDIIEKGSFAQTINRNNGVFPLLADHIPSTDNLLGIVRVEEDFYGLKCYYEINLQTQKGREVYAIAKQMQGAGLPIGASIGYRAVKFEFKEVDNITVRIIKELKLYEVSLVVFPMNDMARMTDVKSFLNYYKNFAYITSKSLESLLKEPKEVEPSDILSDLEADVDKQLSTLIQETKSYVSRTNKKS